MPAIDGRGGGRPEMAQGKGTRRDGLAGGARRRSRRRALERGGLMAFWRRIWQRDGERERSPPAPRSTSAPSSPRRSSSRSTTTGHGTVRGVGRKRQGLSHMQSGTVADIAAVVDNCAVALQEAEEMAGFRPTQVVIGIAGELVKGFTTTHARSARSPTSRSPRPSSRSSSTASSARRSTRPSGRSPGRPACRTSTSGSSTPRSPAPRSTATR